MEAKDTVMSQKEIYIIDECSTVEGDIVPYLNRQVEITWDIAYKAGEESILETIPENLPKFMEDSYADGKKAGMQKVVEWVESNFYKTSLTNIWDGSDIPVLTIKPKSWQAFLKELEK